jgi:hypothetical protein
MNSAAATLPQELNRCGFDKDGNVRGNCRPPFGIDVSDKFCYRPRGTDVEPRGDAGAQQVSVSIHFL